MPGVLEGERVLVRDPSEGSKLYSKGGFGVPLSGGGLELDLLEALYLKEHNRLEVTAEGVPQSVGALLERGARENADFALRYITFRDLRNRAFVVKPAGLADFLVLPRGGFPGRTPAKYVVRVMSERASLDPAGVLAEVREVARIDRQLLVALVDEEGDLTYYEAKEADPRGKVPPELEDLADSEPGVLLAGRVMVFDPAAAGALSEREHYGRDVGPGLQLSIPDALYLMEETGFPIVPAGGGDPVGPEALRARARELQADFDLRYRLYRMLRARGLVVRTGFKFGTHFRAYTASPDSSHAPFLLHAIPRGAGVPWPEASGFVRLGHGVRKTMVFWAEDAGFLQLERTRPS